VLLPWLTLLWIPLYVLAAKSSVHQQLVELAAQNNGVIKLNDKTYDLLTSPDRDWSVSVHFTALDKRRRCNPCREFDPSWNAVAKAWSTVPRSERDNHFFATLDFDDGHTVFQKLGLASAPVVHVYPAAEGPRRPVNGKLAPYKYDFTHGFDAEPLALELSKHTPVAIPYRAPIDWAKWGTFAIILLSGLITLRFISPVLQSRWTWAIGTIITSLVMQSGYMFTRIRGMPYTAGNGQWIAPGFQSQYGQETQVVAVIYGLLAVSFLMLTVIAPLQKSAQRQRAQIYLWTAVNLIIFSVLVSLFRTKNRGYPFKLFL